jgi:peptidoglycan/LPS O-acetylase OafA/YrhL
MRQKRLVGPGVHVPALDGLRGLAVVAVVLYHLWPSAVPGGWLGVGLFFTLSGFLVVGILDDENTEGRVDLAVFYRRRLRRLLPAALATLVAVVGWVVLTDEAARDAIAADGLWAVLNLANWNQMRDAGGYAAIFEQSTEPLGHMWSLAIEEQFYLLAPLAIAWTRRPVAVVGVGFAITVIGHAVWWGTSDAYFATPVRIGEIVAGAALALAIRRRPAVVRVAWLWPLAAVYGIAAVLMLEESADVVVRGFPALIAIGWVVLVAACLRPDTAYAKLLSNDVLRWIGLRSYAIYLIHWPLIELTDWSGPTVIAVTLLGAEVSYRALEDPIRRGRRLPRPVITLVGAAAALGVLFGISATQWEDPTVLADGAAAADLPDWLDAVDAVDEPTTTRPATSEPEIRLPAGDFSGVPIVTVIGDSTATQMAAGLRIHTDTTRTLAVVDRTTSGCSPLIDEIAPWRTYRVSYGYLGEFAFDEPCRTGIDPDDTVVPDLILVVDHGSVMADHLRDDGTWASVIDDDLLEDLRRIYLNRIDEARAVGAVLVFTTAPTMVDSTGLLGSMAQTERLRIYNGLLRDLAAEEDGVEVLELGAVFGETGANSLYPRSDGLHVDLDGAERLAADVLEPALREIAAAA